MHGDTAGTEGRRRAGLGVPRKLLRLGAVRFGNRSDRRGSLYWVHVTSSGIFLPNFHRFNDGGKGENHSERGLFPVSYNLFLRNNINYNSLNIENMITNQVMKRPMGKFLVEQRTKDSMFNATNLLKQWNEFVEHNDDTQKVGYVKKDLDDFFNNKGIKEFIDALMDEENLHTQNSAYVKSKARSDRGGGTWMHPILFVKFAMWLNPRFEVQVIKFVYDQMLKYRNDAGDAYKALGKAIGKIVSKKFMPVAMCKVAKAINYVVFNEHEHEMRNKHGEESKQYELFNMERQVAMLINDGFIHSYDQVIEYLRKKYSEKYLPSVLQTTHSI